MEALINGVKVPSTLLGLLKETSLKNKSDEQLRNSLKSELGTFTPLIKASIEINLK